MARKASDREPSDERRAAVSVEKLRSEFKVVLDGYKGIRDRLDQVEANTAKRHKELHTFMMDGVKTVLDKMDTRFTGVDKRFTDMDTRFADMDQRFTHVDTQLAGMTTRLDTLAVRFEAHEQAHAG